MLHTVLPAIAGYLALTVLVESGLVVRAARGGWRAALRAATALVSSVHGSPLESGGSGADAEAGAAGGDDVDVAAERAALQGTVPSSKPWLCCTDLPGQLPKNVSNLHLGPVLCEILPSCAPG